MKSEIDKDNRRKKFKKAGDIGLSVLGVTLIIGGFISVANVLTDHFKSENDRDDLMTGAITASDVNAEEYVITAPVQKTEIVEKVDTDGDLLEDGVVALDGDQKIAEIKEGSQILDIPELGIKTPILEGTSYDVLKVAVGHFKGTGKMGEGNYCLAGHSISSYACIFDNLHNVKEDIAVNLYDGKGNKYTYYVTSWEVVQPSDTWVIDGYGDNRCTLITCEDKGKTRLVVTAMLMSDEEHELYLKQKAETKRLKVLNLSTEYTDLGISAYIDTLGIPQEKRYGLWGDAYKGKESYGTMYHPKGILNHEGDVVNDV